MMWTQDNYYGGGS